MAIPRTRPHNGPALLSYGLRPFFLLGALQAGLAVLFWLPILWGAFEMPTAFSPRDWHVHEMLYGYLPAVITGYLLASIPNWTGRFPLQGLPLLGLVLVWLAGRIAVSASDYTGWAIAAATDLAFIGLVAAAVAREILAGRNWRNLKLLAVLGALFAGNLSFHIEAHFFSFADYGARIGIAAIVMLVMLVGGRLTPSFTRNWLARNNPGRLPAPSGAFDLVSLIAGGGALAAWVVAPEGFPAGFLLIAAGALQALRLARWAGDRAFRASLVLILNIAYAFIPIGFVLAGLAALNPFIPASAGIHAWGGGAFGGMTLAVMARVSLSHTGRATVGSPALRAIFALVVAAALLRIAAAFAQEPLLLSAAALFWSAAFLGFCAVFWPVLANPSQGKRALTTRTRTGAEGEGPKT